MKTTALPPLIANLAEAILGIWKLKSRKDVDPTEQVHIDPLLGQSLSASFVLGQVILPPNS